MVMIPASVRILGHEFPVRIVHSGEAVSRHATNETIGQTDLTLEHIVLRDEDELSPAKLVEVLVHESLHGAMCLFSLGAYLVGEDDEPFVNAFAPALVHLLRENPALVDAIMGDLSR